MNRTRSLLATTRRAGFTLVELTIVILMISILAALAMPKISQGTTDSKAAVASTAARAMQTRIAKYNEDFGRFPSLDELDPAWFASKQLPENPFRPEIGTTSVNIAVEPGVTGHNHPVFKNIRINGGQPKTFWYNANNGQFRALVDAPANSVRLVELYNKANGANIPSDQPLATQE